MGTHLNSNQSRIERISQNVLALEIIKCDLCKKELALFDIYSASEIEETFFLKRACQKCIPM
ncbi:MAG: hypothetical protein ACE5SW_03530 [Nitrososphaeraceae archaeon]